MKVINENKFAFKWGLGGTGSFVFFIMLLVGLRSNFPMIGDNIAPNVFEFNMYVYDIESPRLGTKFPDILYKNSDSIYRIIDHEKIEALIHSGFLFQGDRWKPYPALVKDFFCKNKQLLDENIIRHNIKVEYLKNKNKLVEIEYEFSCDL